MIILLSSCIHRKNAADNSAEPINENEITEPVKEEEPEPEEVVETPAAEPTPETTEPEETVPETPEETETEPETPETNTTSGDYTTTEEERIERIKNRTIDPDKPMVALTFDDGPSSKFTNKILDTLSDHGAVATFFEVGNIAVNHPDIIKRELELGCELGSHTYSHANIKDLPEDEARAEIDKANDVFIDITGEPASLFRPPYGKMGGKGYLANAPVIAWSVDSEDWLSRDADTIYNKVLEEDTLDGKVVLMHSLYESTYDALQRLMDYFDEHGYQCVTVSELAYYKHGEVLQDGEYYGYSYFR